MVFFEVVFCVFVFCFIELIVLVAICPTQLTGFYGKKGVK